VRALGTALLLLVACANAGDDKTSDAGSDGTSGGSGDGGGSGSATTECPIFQLATNVSGTKQVTCTTVDGLAKQAIGEHCSAYLGWRDSCDGCTTAPAKWGRANTGSCSPGVGTNNTCTMPTLDGADVQLFGLDLDGDMDGNDKLHAGLHCTADTSTGGGVGPCPAGQLVDGFNGTAWTCSSFAKTAIAYVQNRCAVYLGWQDNCDGCTTQPGKWGYTSEAQCSNGAGLDSTCNAPTLLGTENVRLFGINPDGDVDDNDKLHVGLRCDPADDTSSMQIGKCPADSFVAATSPDGSFRCDAAGPMIERYFRDHCTLYFGWHDSCDGCITPPTKWGKVRVGACTLGAGANDTCSTFMLGSDQVTMFGLNTDGNVDENDVFYVGFRCD
jgi:hypothetical protein